MTLLLGVGISLGLVMAMMNIFWVFRLKSQARHQTEVESIVAIAPMRPNPSLTAAFQAGKQNIETNVAYSSPRVAWESAIDDVQLFAHSAMSVSNVQRPLPQLDDVPPGAQEFESRFEAAQRMYQETNWVH